MLTSARLFANNPADNTVAETVKTIKIHSRIINFLNLGMLDAASVKSTHSPVNKLVKTRVVVFQVLFGRIKRIFTKKSINRIIIKRIAAVDCMVRIGSHDGNAKLRDNKML